MSTHRGTLPWADRPAPKTQAPTGPKAGFTDPGDPADEDWRVFAACSTEDPELFFPIGNTGPALLQIEDAKAVCRRCDAVDACLTWALETGQDAGVWGGTSEDERRNLKRRAMRRRLSETRRAS